MNRPLTHKTLGAQALRRSFVPAVGLGQVTPGLGGEGGAGEGARAGTGAETYSVGPMPDRAEGS